MNTDELIERRISYFTEPFAYPINERGGVRIIDRGIFKCSCHLTMINLGEVVIRELIAEHTAKGHLCNGRVRTNENRIHNPEEEGRSHE